MRKSKEAATESRRRIIDDAAWMLRVRGVEATSLADLMHAAGMTHGGFYKAGSGTRFWRPALRRRSPVADARPCGHLPYRERDQDTDLQIRPPSTQPAVVRLSPDRVILPE